MCEFSLAMLFPEADEIWDSACLLADRYSFQPVIEAIYMNWYMLRINCLSFYGVLEMFGNSPREHQRLNDSSWT